MAEQSGAEKRTAAQSKGEQDRARRDRTGQYKDMTRMEETGKGRKVEHVHGCSWPPFMAPLKQGCRESPVEGSLLRAFG